MCKIELKPTHIAMCCETLYVGTLETQKCVAVILTICDSSSLWTSTPDGHLYFDPIRIRDGLPPTSSVLLLSNYFHEDSQIEHMTVLL